MNGKAPTQPSSPLPSNSSTSNPNTSGSPSGRSLLGNQFSEFSQSLSSNLPGSSAKQVSSLLSRASSLTSSVTSNVAGVAGRLKEGLGTRTKTLLVVDDASCDWSRYFRGRKLAGEYEIRVEQAHFAELAATAHSQLGLICAVYSVERGVPRPARHFKPDFVLIRQHVVDAQRDSRPIVLALQYGQVPAVNSLHSVYNFADRPWVYAQLINIQRKLGKDRFPLIEQTFYTNYREMLQTPPKFPCVIKMGHSHGGLGKLRAESLAHFQELLCALACCDSYLTVEPYVNAKCDLHVQKIGANYKAFMRKSISGHWKSNMGGAMLEQVPISDQHRRWLDEIAGLFDGLDLLTIEIVQTKDDQQFIYEVTGSQMSLMGETQEEDRRLIADLVVTKVQQAITSEINLPASVPSEEERGFFQRIGNIGGIGNTIEKTIRRGSTGNESPEIIGNSDSQSAPQQMISETVDKTAQQIRGLFRRASQNASSEEKPDEADDTMKNLRKTFAGIFGDN